MANNFKFGAFGSGSFGSGTFGGQKKEPENKSTGTGVSRSPSVVFDDLNDEEKNVYKPLYQQKMRENPDDPTGAMLFAEDGLFTWQNNQKYFDPKGNLVSGQMNQQAAGRTPSIIYDNIQDKNDKQAYYLGYRDFLRKNPGDLLGAQIAGEDEIRRNHLTEDQQLAESMLGDLSRGSNAPLYLKDQNVIGDLLTMNGAGKDQVSKALPQYDFGIFKPKNQGPTDAAYAAAMLDRQEREQRDRDDAATGAGSRVQQIVAEKELERALADGSIQNEQLRQQAENDLARVRNSNQAGDVFDQNGLAGLWSTIDAIRNEGKAQALPETQPEETESPYTFGAVDTNLYRSNMEAAQKKIRDEIAGGTMQPEELESAEADLAALTAYMDGTDTSAEAKENASAITEAWNKEAVDKRNPVESFLADIPQLIRESTLNNMYSIINALAGNTDAEKLNTPTLDKYTQAGRDAYNKVNDAMWGGVDAVTNAAYNFIKGVGEGLQSAVVGANALAKLFGFDAVNNALLGENAVDTTKSREYLTNQIQKGIVEPADKEAVRFKENLQPKITTVLSAFGMDKETAQSAADIAMTYMGQSSEMVGRMVPSLVASWAAGGSGAGEAANIIGRLMNSWKTPGFLSLWLTSTGEAYQGAIDRNGENVTYGDALASLIGGFFDATIENYETKWGFSNGVQAIAGGRRFPRFSEMVGGIASETSEELKQLFSGDVWENFGDILSGRQLTHALNGDTEESLFYVAKYLDTAKDTVFTTLGMNTIIGAGNVAANMYQNAVQAVVDGNATPEQMEQAQQVAVMAAVAQEDQVKDATVTTPSTEEQHDMFEAGLAGGDQGAHSDVDGRAQAEVEIRNQQGTDNNWVDTDADVRAAEQRMREAQAAEVQAIIASNNQTAQAEERARLEQEARDAIERRKLAEAEYQRAQAAAGAAISNQNEQVNLRTQEEEQARTAQEEAAKYEMRLRQAQENLARAEEAARQQNMQAKDRKEAEKQAGIARRQLRRAQEAYNNALKAVEDQNRQADARKEADETAWNSIDERNRALQAQYDQTNQNAAGVIADQNQQAADRAQLEQDARIAEMRMQGARAAEVQAIIASNSQTEQAEERQRLAQEAQDAIARRKAAEEEYRQAKAAADAAVQGQNAQADERSAREDEANTNRENLDDITRRISEAGTQDNIQLTPEQVQEIINGYHESEETEGYEGEEEQEKGGEGAAEGRPEAEGQTSAEQEIREEEAGGNEGNKGTDEEDRRGEGTAEGKPEAEGQTSDSQEPREEEAGGNEGNQGTDVQEETRRGEGTASSEQETEGQASEGKEIREEGENEGSQGISAPQENRNNGEGSAQGEQETGGEISKQQVTQDETGENAGNVGAAEATDEETPTAGSGEAQGRQESGGEISAEQPVQQQEESEETAGNAGENAPAADENVSGAGEAAGNYTQNTNGETNEEQRKADEINRTFGFNQRNTDGSTSYKPGLTVSSWKGELSDQTRTELQVIHEYAKEHGFSVVMDSTLRTSKVKGVVNGFYAKDEGGGRVIHLAQDGMAPLRTTLGHELYHMISNLNRNGAQQMERLYREYASRMGIDVEELIDKKLKSYKDLLDKDAQKARAQALEEVIADAMYDVIGDERTMRVLAMEDRGMAERIRDWADRVLRDIRRLIDRYGSNKAEARVLHEQADAMENMRAAIERVLAETKELQDAKKAASSLGSNSQMLNDYHQMMDTATTRDEMNAATLALAGQVLEKGGIEANWDNMRTLMTAALDYASGGGVISQVLNAYDMGTWIPSDEANRAFVSMGRYIKQMLESQDEAGYMQLMGMEPEDAVKYSVHIENGNIYVELDYDQKRFDGLTENEARKEALKILQKRFVNIPFIMENGEAKLYGKGARHITRTFESGTKEIKMLKARASVEFDNLMRAARFTGQEAAKHEHKDWAPGDQAVDGYDVTIKMGDLIADYHITVGNHLDGSKEIYDMRYKKEESTGTEHAERANKISNNADTETNASVDIKAQKEELVKKQRIEKRDESYRQAVENDNKLAQKNLVKKAAAENGYNPNVNLYHGTQRFGYTAFNTDVIWTTTNEGVAAGYANHGRVRSTNSQYVEDHGDPRLIIKNAKNVLGSDYEQVNEHNTKEIREKRMEEFKKANDKLAEPLNKIDQMNLPNEMETRFWDVTGLFQWLIDEDEAIFENREYAKQMLDESYGALVYPDVVESFDKLRDYYNEHREEIQNSSLKDAFEAMFNGYEVGDALIEYKYGYRKLALGEGDFINTATKSVASEQELREWINREKREGIYKGYGKLGDRPLIVNADKAYWLSIKAPVLGDGYYSTDQIVKWAKEHNYTSVVIKNVMDPAIVNDYGDDYVFFDSSQFKSSENITYDDVGNVIPLSERFNDQKQDIRYSYSDDIDQEYQDAVDSGNVEEQQRMVDAVADAFGYDSNVDLYHGTKAHGFTEFNTDYIYTTTNKWVAAGYSDKTLKGGTENRYTEDNGDPNIVIRNAENILGRTFEYVGNGLYKEQYHKNTITEKELKDWIKEQSRYGVYKGYGNLGNKPLVIDAKGAYWKNIKVGSTVYSTDEIAKYAKDMGYTSVVIKNVMDSKGIDQYGDDYIFFKSNQFKTSEPVTHDDAGNVIPLSERFNDQEPDIRWSAETEETEDDSTRYAVDPDDARDMLDLGSDIARTSDAGWQVIDTMRQMKLRQTQNEDGAVQQTPGYWKKQVPEIAKSLKEYTYGKDQKTIEKAVKELYADLDSYQGDARGFVDYALREAQGTMRDLYTDERENPTRDNLKAFFDKYGPLYVTEEQKKELRYYAGGMTEFRRQAAGLVPITNKKSGIGLEEVWEELAPLIGKDPSIVSVGTMIMEFNDAIEKARSVNGEERTLTDEEMAMLDRRALDLVAEYMEAGATVVPTRTVEKIDADKHQQALKEVSRLQDETEKQNAEIERLNKKLEDADNVNQSLNRQLFDQAKVVDQLKKSNATRAEVEEARAAYREIAAQSAEAVKAMKDLQKKLETVRQRRDEYRRQLAQAHRAEQQYEKAQHQIERLQAGRDNLKKQIEQMKLKAMDTRLIARQTRERNKALTNIRKKGGELRAMFASPSEKKGYIPMDQVRAAADLVESLVDAEKGGSAAKMSKRLENALRDARESNDYKTSVMYDEGLYHDMQDVTRLLEDKGSLRNLSNSELNFVEGTLTSIVHQIKTSNETVGRQKNQALQDEAEDAIRVMKENPRELNGIGRLIRKLGLTQLNAQRVFSLLGHHGNNAWTRMRDELSEGQRKKNMLTMNMTKTFENLTRGENEKKFDKFTGKNAVWYDTGLEILKDTGEGSGRTWKMNGAMRAFFGLSWMSEENREAMRAVGEKSEGGGDLYQLTIPDEELMKKGKEKEAYARGERVFFTAQDAERIIGEMTDYEKAWMNAWWDMEKLSKAAINETSQLLNGYRKANVNRYVPIFRDPRYIGKEFESVVTDARLTSMGFLKERVNAHNPMMLMDLTNVINRQVRDVSAYYGFAIPVRNATRIYNGKMPGNTTSVKEVINKTQGMEYAQYFEKLMSDLQGGIRTESSILDKMRGTMAAATLGVNPTVRIKQAASYPTAAAVIGWKPLAKALKYANPVFLKNFNPETEIDPYTSAHWERRSQNLSDLEANAHRNTKAGKFYHYLTNGIQRTDISTTAVIWMACGEYVAENQPELKKGSLEFKQAQARVYEQTLESTQPEYGELQKAGVLRSNNQLVKQFTMYKTQSLQNLGILVDAVTNLSDKAKADKANSTPETQAALREAKIGLARSTSALITGAVVLGVMQALGQALKHKLGGYRDDKGDLTAESVSNQIFKDSISSLAGMVVGGSEAFDFFNGLIEGKSPFDIEAASASMINDMYQNLWALGNSVSVIADSDKTPEQKLQALLPKFRKLGLSAAQMYGVPAGNILGLIDGIAANAADFATGKAGTFASQSPLQIAGTALIGSAQGRETSNKAVAGYIAQAMMEGRQAEAVRLYNEQLRQGKTADALNSAIATWQKANIPEIREAAEAIDSGDLVGYNSKINQLVEMGLSMTNAVKYVEAVRKKNEKSGELRVESGANSPMSYQDIVSGMTKTTATSEENSYTNGMMNSLLEDNNIEAAKAIRDDMLKNGKKSSAINSSLTSHWKPLLQAAYAEGDMAEVRRITNMLVSMGMKRTTVTGWATSGSSTSSSSSSKKTGFGSGSFGSGGFGSSSKKSSSKKKTGFGSGSFGSGTFGK